MTSFGSNRKRAVILVLVLSSLHFYALVYFSLLSDGHGWAGNVANVLSFPACQVRQRLHEFGSIGRSVWALNSLLWGLGLSLIVWGVRSRIQPQT